MYLELKDTDGFKINAWRWEIYSMQIVNKRARVVLIIDQINFTVYY